MWKKLENFAGSRLDSNANEATNSNSDLENTTESLEDPWLVSAANDQDQDQELEAAQAQREQAGPVTLGAYTEAVTKFTKSASAFIEHLPLLAEARQAYEEATKASAELRTVLDAGDENLRTLMSHLEQMANVQLVGPSESSIPSGRTPEASKLGPVRVGEEAKGAIKRFP